MKKLNNTIITNAPASETSISSESSDPFSVTAGAVETPSVPGVPGTSSGPTAPDKTEKEARLEELKQDVLLSLQRSGYDTSKFTLDVYQHIDRKHRNVLWYGGVIAVVEYKGYTFSLEARGDIDATLLSKDGEVIQASQDKTNSGGFYADMKDYLVDDDALVNACNVGADDIETVLWLKEENWLEVFIRDSCGNFFTETWEIDDDNIQGGLYEMILMIGHHFRDRGDDYEEAEEEDQSVPMENIVQLARLWGRYEVLSGTRQDRMIGAFLMSYRTTEITEMLYAWALEYEKEHAACPGGNEDIDAFFDRKVKELFEEARS